MPGPFNPVRTDPLRPLRAFAQVARLGSVSRAAEILGLSQPAVSLQLQALAREHGVTLLERSGRRLVPTAAGEALLALARPLVDGIDGLGLALQARLEGQAPRALAVAAGGVALRCWLPRVDPAWRADTPLQVRHAGGSAALDLLRDGSVALAVGSWLQLPGDIEFVALVHSPARLLAPASHPLVAAGRPTPAEVARYPLVLPRHRGTSRQLLDLAFGRAGVAPSGIVDAGDWHAACALVALGQGVAVSTALAIEPIVDPRVTLLPLSDAFPARPYGVAMRRGRTPDTVAQAYIDALRVAAADLQSAFEA